MSAGVKVRVCATSPPIVRVPVARVVWAAAGCGKVEMTADMTTDDIKARLMPGF